MYMEPSGPRSHIWVPAGYLEARSEAAAKSKAARKHEVSKEDIRVIELIED